MPRLEFTKKTKLEAFQRADGNCEHCGARLSSGNIEYDHITAVELKSDASLENCQVLCKSCHKAKTKDDVKVIAKSNRVRAAHAGIKKRSGFRGWRKFNGEPVWK